MGLEFRYVRNLRQFVLEVLTVRPPCVLSWRDIPKQFNGAETDKRQKHENSQAELQEKYKAFLRVAKYCEQNSGEQITVIELTKKMEEDLEQTGSKQKAYGVQYMKKKLEEHFGNRIIFTNLEVKANVMTLCDDDEEEARRIIQTAAKLIKSSIKALNSLLNTPVSRIYVPKTQ